MNHSGSCMDFSFYTLKETQDVVEIVAPYSLFSNAVPALEVCP